MSVRVLLADDHVIMRQGLRTLLEREGFEVVGEASNGQEAIRLCASVHPEVAVLDLSMPILNGIDAAREIVKGEPKTKAILLTMHTDEDHILESLRAGVSGYVLKTKSAEELIQAIRGVCKGEMYLSPGISRVVVQAYVSRAEISTNPLSDRERQVLQLVAEGKATKEIASLLNISVKTVESHRTNIMDKLNIHDTAGLVRYSIRHGLIGPDI
jgi:two-component system, NarL family, response regulator NreC